jgi:hypothetical protein
LGKRIKARSMEALEGAPWLTVIGVVDDVRHYGFEEDTSEPAMYTLYRQVPGRTGAMTLLSRASPESLAPLMRGVRGEIRELDATLAADVDTLEARLASGVSEQRLIMSALSSFSTLALVLAAIGIYGLQSFAVVRRTREIAVRAALGAAAGSILRMVIVDAARVAAVGTAVGLLAALSLASLIEAFLVGVGPHDPVTFAVVVGILMEITTLAAAIPAVRAARLDPLEALRGT